VISKKKQIVDNSQDVNGLIGVNNANMVMLVPMDNKHNVQLVLIPIGRLSTRHIPMVPVCVMILFVLMVM
jgi:hypothetical protein